jgi:hypothetical protein
MTVFKFIKSKQITLKEVEDNFIEFDRKEVVANSIQGCFNCGDVHNNSQHDSEPWTAVFHCVKCTSLSFVIFCDRMGGNVHDTVIIFKEKQV